MNFCYRKERGRNHLTMGRIMDQDLRERGGGKRGKNRFTKHLYRGGKEKEGKFLSTASSGGKKDLGVSAL